MTQDNDRAGFDMWSFATREGPVILYRVEGQCGERHRPQFWAYPSGEHLGDDRGSPAEAALDLVNVPPPPGSEPGHGHQDAASPEGAKTGADDDAGVTEAMVEAAYKVLTRRPWPNKLTMRAALEAALRTRGARHGD